MNTHAAVLTRGLAILALSLSATAAAPAVELWETNLVVPTYRAAPPSHVPRFYEGRTYQGAKATFYPYAVQDRLTDTKADASYRALFIENAYVQICVLPELGGRIWSARDKVNGYDFFYRQHVVKPALIGMLGAWISGGVEWNVPHHHRASSFLPVDHALERHGDGSATIWVGETELRHRLSWLVGLRLYPDRSYLELDCKMFNRTPFAHPMLFWINPAVHANDQYQVLFPPATEWAVQHGKPEFASWPVARQVYGGTDYTRGVDISWWKNHPSPVSFFAWNDEDEWFGGYDHGRQAGVLHWADRHVAPGKKFFEWGNGPEGEMWTRILSDDDGPYLELMAGAWSDNQPDYSWIQPGETREWRHWWYPIRELGGVKAATRDAAVNLEVTNRTVRLALQSTAVFPEAQIALASPAATLLGTRAHLQPDRVFVAELELPPGMSATEPLQVTVRTRDGRDLVSYAAAPPRGTPMPKPVERPRSPKDYATSDELYFTGLRIQQLYSPSFEAAPYYEEMLRRDAGDYRAHVALGILACEEWRWVEAEAHLRQALERATANYIRPRDTEVFYYLGVALRAQGKYAAAGAALRKALWNPVWHAAGGCWLAELELLQGNDAQALADIELALAAAGRNAHARNLKATILRRLGQPEAAETLARETLVFAPLNIRAAAERILAQRQRGDDRWRANVEQLRRQMNDNPEAYLELTFEFAQAGQWNDVIEILRARVRSARGGEVGLAATELYLLAYALEREGRGDQVSMQLIAAAASASGLCFPSRYEEEAVFRWALAKDPEDAHAAYLLGCLLYDRQPAAAIRAWEEARQRNRQVALVHRNLGLAYAQHEKDLAKATASLEQAVALDAAEPRFFYELDRLDEASGAPVLKRLGRLLDHHAVVVGRDDALTRELELLIVAGLTDSPKLDRALELLRSHHFRNWEGSSHIHGVYVDACLARGRQRLGAGAADAALEDFRAALEYPENLEVGRARRAPRRAQIQYHLGLAHRALGDGAAARTAFEQAVARKESTPSESQFYYGRALEELGRHDEAQSVFAGLVQAGERQLAGAETPDYFAKFGERQSERVRQAGAHYLLGLGRLGKGEREPAAAEFERAIELHPAHLGASSMRAAAGG
ncbi:MAG: DUF5107 domain-containing protein [Verrucomicrobia bacterium]|nr:DUF5107 domain-containing protein [Verrucomicrobiota bacterium]